MRKADILTGTLCLIFSVGYYFYLVPAHIIFSIPQEQVTRLALRADFIPRLVILFFAFLSVFLVLGALRQTEEGSAESVSRQSYFQVVVVFVIAYAYTYCLEFAGFLLSSPIFLAVLISYMGTRTLRLVAPVAALLPVFVYYLFWLGFRVSLPEGSIW